MEEGQQAYVLAYDIADDRRRHRLVKVLDGYGRRIQYSVYEAVLDRRLFDNLVAKISGIVDETADRVAIYRLCVACSERRLCLGRAPPEWPGEEDVYIV